MNQSVNLKLFNGDNLLLDVKDIQAKYEYNNLISYNIDNRFNEYDYINNIFTHKTLEYEMKINFNKKICTFDFQKEGSTKFDIECSNSIKDDEILLKYIIDEEEIKIIISFNKITL